MLVHYDDQLPIALATDASPYGVGAVLFYVIECRERPIAYASRTLSDAEKRYGQIEREGTAILFKVKHFEKYLFGRRFKLYTDHRPLTHIFHPSTQFLSRRCSEFNVGPYISLTSITRSSTAPVRITSRWMQCQDLR